MAKGKNPRIDVYAKVKGPDGKYHLVKQPGETRVLKRSEIDPALRKFIEGQHRDFLQSISKRIEKKRKAA